MANVKKSLTKIESTSKANKANKVTIPTSKAQKRVIAPYVKIIRKGQQAGQERAEESKYLSLALEKKPSAILEDLATFLSDSVDFPSLLHDTADVLKTITKASGVSLYLVDSSQEEIYLSQKNVPGDRNKVKWKIQQGTTIAAYAAYKKTLISVDKFIFDERFPDGLGYKDEIVGSILSVPVVTPDGVSFAVIELYRDIAGTPFEKANVQIVVSVAVWMGAAVHQNQLRVALSNQQKLSDYLLYLTKCYFGGVGAIEKVVTALVKFVKECLGAERGCLYILDKESDDFVADLFEEGIDDSDLHKKNVKVRIGKDRAIVSYVVRTGNTVNIKDAYNDPRFNREPDQRSGIITRSMLCMAIKSFDDILGIVQVSNKKSGGSFTKIDESIFSTFATYCALTLHHYNLRKLADKTDKINICHLKLLTRQQEPCIHDLTNFLAKPDAEIAGDFRNFSWSPSTEINLLPNLTFLMINEIIGREDLIGGKLCQFILTVKKNYQNIPYHNFEHGFASCHCMYNILRRNMKMFSPIECKGLMIAALCHDVDHPGFTNNYLVVIRDNLSQLYQDSILENHHFRTTIVILNYCNVFNDLNEFTYKLIKMQLKEAILATDVCNSFRDRLKLEVICRQNALEFGNTAHRILVKSLMMSCCDLAGQCKPFNVAKKVADNIHCENIKQGDDSKTRSLTPLLFYDRDKRYFVAENQVQFLAVVVIPCMNLLRKIFPNTAELPDLAVHLKDTWDEIIDLRGQKCWRPDDSIPYD